MRVMACVSDWLVLGVVFACRPTHGQFRCTDLFARSLILQGGMNGIV